MNAPPSKHAPESGNVLLIILLAVMLIGALSVAIQGTGSGGSNIDRETLLLRASDVKRYAGELERGAAFILQNGVSEYDIRFAHPDAHADYGDINTNAQAQMFHRLGGGVTYQSPPAGVNNASPWEFYGNTALPEVGSSEPELIAVLPNVTAEFCAQMNKSLGYDDSTQPTDSGTCLHGAANARFDDGVQFASTPNTTDEASFSKKPAPQACVQCGADYHYYAVLLAR